MLSGWQILPRKFGTLKWFMRLTFVVWTAAVLFGLGTYYVWYLRPVEAVSIADNMIRHLNSPKFAQVGGYAARETGWALRGLIGVYNETY